MIAVYTLERRVQETGISFTTSFYLIHNILDVVKKFLETGSIEGIVEYDNTFFRKGNHSQNSVFKMPRKAYKGVITLDQNVIPK